MCVLIAIDLLKKINGVSVIENGGFMISKYNLVKAKKYCCEDVSLIENYNNAVLDFNKYDCHHRLEIQENGVLFSRKELVKMNLYYNRPAYELIFLTHSDHARLHSENRPKEVLESISRSNKGKHHTEETKKILSENHKGVKNGMYGKDPWNKNKRGVYTEEHLRILSERKMGENNVFFGTHYFNNGEVEIRSVKCPKGFVKGRLKNNLMNLKQYKRR